MAGVGKEMCAIVGVLGALMAGTLVPAGPVRAEDAIVLFQDVPSADEVLDALGAVPRPAVVKMRGARAEEEGGTRYKTRAVILPGGQAVVSPVPAERPQHSQTAASAPAQGGASSMSPTAPAPVKMHPRPQTKKKTAVALPLTFELNSAELTAEARRYVDSVAEALRKKPDMELRISGHTDARGGDDLNNALSLRRAQSVHRYLIERHSIDGRRMTVAGEGARRPLDARNPYADINRRVEFSRQGDGTDPPACGDALVACTKGQAVPN